MLNKLTTVNPKITRLIIAIGALTMFVLSAGAPQGYGG
jgi:hypothetical protein